MAVRQTPGKRMSVDKKNLAESPSAVEYRGKRTKTGNSMGFRFESALFRSHPEFSGTVRAQVIAPGQLLVTADPAEVAEEDDPVLGPFLALIAKDMAENPHKIKPLDEARMRRIAELTKDVVVNDDEDFGDEDLLSWP